MKIGYLLLWYKPFRKACIKELINYVQYTHVREIEGCLCFYFHRHYNPKKWMVCWTKIKEIRKNKDSVLVDKINCKGIQFVNNYDRLKFLKECLNKM